MLSVEAPQRPDLAGLYDACPPIYDPNDASLPAEPLTSSDLDVLLALCDAAPLVQDVQEAEKLLNHLKPYLIEACVQLIDPSPFFPLSLPSPWELLSKELTLATLGIGINHPALHDAVFDCITEYLHRCFDLVHSVVNKPYSHESPSAVSQARELLHTATISVSLVGFLEAAASFAHFFTVPESLELIRSLRRIFDENLMVTVEGVFSSIRTSEHTSKALTEWASYTRQYASSGRPLGAMLLQCGFLKLTVSCTSILVSTVERLQCIDVLDDLLSMENCSFDCSTEAKVGVVSLVCETITESMRLLEDGFDYLQLGPSWQQELAFDVKAQILRAFLICMILDEEIADVDLLISWLEDTMADPSQMAHETLAAVVLKSMAVVGKVCPSVVPALSRSLSSFLVQGNVQSRIVAVAAQSLAYILQLLSHDAVITGLYSLGNNLSARSGPDRSTNGTEALTNGGGDSSTINKRYTHAAMGSASSVELGGEEDNAMVHGNIIHAIVSMAYSCKDDKIIALAQSMLVQKLGRLTLAVDLHIVKEAATLAVAGGPQEFRSLLKLYTRLAHDALVQGNETLASSVRFPASNKSDLTD